MTETTDPLRIPIAHSVRYAARGLPEVPNQYGDGILAPSEITLTYRAAPDSGLGRVHAYVAGRLWANGAEIPLLPGGLYGQYYDDGLDGWPEWLAEEARLHDPDASAGPSVPADAGLRDRIAQALADNDGWVWAESFDKTRSPSFQGYLRAADAVLAVHPAPADRAAVLREAAVELRKQTLLHDDCVCVGELRRMADEAQQAGCGCGHAADEHSVYGCADGCACEWMPKRPPMDPVHILGIGADEAQQAGEGKPVAYRTPGARSPFCVICARQESDKQSLTAAEVTDDTVCNFCGGRVLAVAAESLGAVVNRYFDDEQAGEGR